MKVDEKILVVERNVILRDAPFQGFLPLDNFKDYEQSIVLNQKFLWRSVAEEDVCYKQIIPYLIFSHNQRIFVMQRRSNASEKRLRNKYSLGIGGHIRQEDIEGKSLVDWARREFDEEVAYCGPLKIQPLGLINDDSDMVGKVHLGFVFLLKGVTDSISIKDEHKSGNLMTLDEMKSFYDDMESWSQCVYTFLSMHQHLIAHDLHIGSVCETYSI